MGTKESTVNHTISCTQDNDYRKKRMEKKLLMLGSTKSGKTKLFNKIKYSNGHQMDQKQRLKLKSCIIKYVINSFQKLLRCIESNKNTFSPNDTAKECSEIIQSIYLNESYDETNKINEDWHIALNYIDILWQQKSFKTEILKNAYFIDDSIEYFLNNIQRLNEFIYIPTDNDIIHFVRNDIRKQNLSISNSKITIRGTTINVFDVCDMNNDYKKWIHCFDDITMLVFVAGLTSYYHMIYNDNYNEELEIIKLKQSIAMEFLIEIIGVDILELILSYVPDEPQIGKNAMIESIHMFDETIHNKYFHNTYIILLLNNMELFQDKIINDNENHVKSFMICFPEYNGNVDSGQECSKYIAQMFNEKNTNYNQRSIYTHYISDSDGIDHLIHLLFNDVQDCVNQISLSAGGLL